MKALFQLLVIIVLMIGAIMYSNELKSATTELATLKAGFCTVVMSIYLIGACIIVRMENKD